MHESIPADSLLATRLKSGYYTAEVPRSAYPVPRPVKPESSTSDSVWETYIDARTEYNNTRRKWLAAASERQREARQEEFRADLIAALGLDVQGAKGVTLVEAAEFTAKENGAEYAFGRDDDYDFDAPLTAAELRYAADIAARFAALLRPPVAAAPEFAVDMYRGGIMFYADGEEAPCECLTLRLDDVEQGFFALWEGGTYHDGHSSLDEVARAFPLVAASLEDWKAGRTLHFAAVLDAAKALAGQ